MATLGPFCLARHERRSTAFRRRTARSRAALNAIGGGRTRSSKRALGETLETVLHVGSTSIRGIKAKPIVDLMPLVTDLEPLDAEEQQVRTLGYLWCGEYGLPRRRYCILIDPATGRRQFHLHCFRQGDPEIDRHVAFRDYLRAHPSVAKAYEAEKIRAAAAAPHDMNAYNAEKNDWIQRVEKKALAWRALNPLPPEP